ncbi:hypothetical protein [Silvibacterium sp.]|uniref:tetratricopeptide repeat protein n=1 Tax=Silvibacterium sp. TaxID=1964179 RepID=UPI0039E5E44B
MQIAAAGLGAAVAGPLGGAIGGWLAGALGASAGKLVETYAEKFGDSAADKILSLGEDSLLDKLKDPARHLDDLYRQTLRVSLQQLASQNTDAESAGWFRNWEVSLAAPQPLALDAVEPEQYRRLDELFCRTMIRIDAEGAAIREGNKVSISLTLRELPAALRTSLLAQLPPLLDENFRSLIVTPDYEQAWKSSQLAFQEAVGGKLDRMGADILGIRSDLHTLVETQLRVAEENRRLEAENARLQAQLLAFANAQQTAQSATLISLLSIRDFSGAIHLKTEAIDKRRLQLGQGSAKPEELARDLFELGMIYELQRDWPKARDTYRDAWKIDPTFEHGFKYGYAARTLNDDSTAITAYEQIAGMPASDGDHAALLTNLGILYSRNGQNASAEKSYLEAIEQYSRLAILQPDRYLADLSGTYGDLAQFYAGTGADPAKVNQLYLQALNPLLEAGKSDPVRWLPLIAEMYTSLGNYQAQVGKDSNAELSYRKALGAYTEVRSRNGAVDIGKVAYTLGRFAALESRIAPAEKASEEYETAIAAMRVLARQANLAIYGPLLIEALFGRAQWRASQNHMAEAWSDAVEAGQWIAPLWQAAPRTYGDLRARLLIFQAGVGWRLPEQKEHLCPLAQEALTCASEVATRERAQTLVAQLCGAVAAPAANS